MSNRQIRKVLEGFKWMMVYKEVRKILTTWKYPKGKEIPQNTIMNNISIEINLANLH